MTARRRVAVIGGSLAAVRLIRGLRRKGFDGEVILISDETELPYDRPPLSKRFLTAEVEPPPRLLEPQSFYEDVELRLGARAIELRLSERAVVLDDGSAVRADDIVVATGAEARSLPGLPDGQRVGRLRTVEDARRLRAALDSGRPLVVLGGGFIGCEVAASARARGVEVTIIEPQESLVARGAGTVVGEVLADAHREKGVEVRLGVGVESAKAGGKSVVVTMTDGCTIEAGFVVVGIGARPQADWLRGSGVEVGDGVLCDAQCRVLGGGGRVWAVGDVAAWPSARTGMIRRLEHWTNAAEQAGAVAANLVGGGDAAIHDPIPYVWSDQFEYKLQMLGDIDAEDETTVLEGSLADRRFVLGYSRDGRLRGAVACDMPRAMASLRPLIADSAPLAEVIERA